MKKIKNLHLLEKNILAGSEKKKIQGGVIPIYPTCEYGFRVCDCGTSIGVFCISVKEECPKHSSGNYMCIDFGV